MGVGNGNRLPSGHCWTRPVASGWFALESLADEPTELPVSLSARGFNKAAPDCEIRLDAPP